MASDKNWSDAVTHRIPATYHSQGVYTRSAADIYKEMRRPEVSPRGLGSAISMNQFYINRAGKNLSEERKEIIRESIRYLQTELRYHNALAKGGKDLDELKKAWEELQTRVDLSGEPESVKYVGTKAPPAKDILEIGVNKYLEKIASQLREDTPVAARIAGAGLGITGAGMSIHNLYTLSKGGTPSNVRLALGTGAGLASLAMLHHYKKKD